MSLRKFQSVEKTQVLGADEQAKISANLHKLGKTSAVALTDEERAKALDSKPVN
jgi:hypothetical protein